MHKKAGNRYKGSIDSEMHLNNVPRNMSPTVLPVKWNAGNVLSVSPSKYFQNTGFGHKKHGLSFIPLPASAIKAISITATTNFPPSCIATIAHILVHQHHSSFDPMLDILVYMNLAQTCHPLVIERRKVWARFMYSTITRYYLCERQSEGPSCCDHAPQYQYQFQCIVLLHLGNKLAVWNKTCGCGTIKPLWQSRVFVSKFEKDQLTISHLAEYSNVIYIKKSSWDGGQVQTHV